MPWEDGRGGGSGQNGGGIFGGMSRPTAPDKQQQPQQSNQPDDAADGGCLCFGGKPKRAPNTHNSNMAVTRSDSI